MDISLPSIGNFKRFWGCCLGYEGSIVKPFSLFTCTTTYPINLCYHHNPIYYIYWLSTLFPYKPNTLFPYKPLSLLTHNMESNALAIQVVSLGKGIVNLPRISPHTHEDNKEVNTNIWHAKVVFMILKGQEFLYKTTTYFILKVDECHNSDVIIILMEK